MALRERGQPQVPSGETEFKRWRRKLLYATLAERLHAADVGAPEQDTQSIEALVEALSADELVMRVAVIQALERYGVAATLALLGGLEHPCFRTRMKVIAALGRVGGGEAVQPLTQMMRLRLGDPRLARKGLVNARYLIFPAIILGLIFLAKWPVMLVFMSFSGFIPELGNLLARYRRAREMKVLAAALERIAAREPQAGLQALIPALETAAGDVVMHSNAARRTCRELANSLDELTRASLPIAAGAPAASRESLPVISEAASPEAGSLPRV